MFSSAFGRLCFTASVFGPMCESHFRFYLDSFGKQRKDNIVSPMMMIEAKGTACDSIRDSAYPSSTNKYCDAEVCDGQPRITDVCSLHGAPVLPARPTHIALVPPDKKISRVDLPRLLSMR